MQLTTFTNRVLDTTKQWLVFSTCSLVITLVLHAFANGWVGPWVGHNWYNDPRTSWIGTYPIDIMHFLAGFSIGAVIFNFDLGRLKRSYMLVPILATLVIVQLIGLGWEWLELIYFGANPGGFIQVSLLDTLFDETMDFVGALVSVWVGEHLTV